MPEANFPYSAQSGVNIKFSMATMPPGMARSTASVKNSALLWQPPRNTRKLMAVSAAMLPRYSLRFSTRLSMDGVSTAHRRPGTSVARPR